MVQIAWQMLGICYRLSGGGPGREVDLIYLKEI